MLETKILLRPLNRICQACDMLLNHINLKILIRLKAHSHNAIANANRLSQLIGCSDLESLLQSQHVDTYIASYTTH